MRHTPSFLQGFRGKYYLTRNLLDKEKDIAWEDWNWEGGIEKICNCDERESGEWKYWLKAQHSENEDHGI